MSFSRAIKRQKTSHENLDDLKIRLDGKFHNLNKANFEYEEEKQKIRTYWRDHWLNLFDYFNVDAIVDDNSMDKINNLCLQYLGSEQTCSRCRLSYYGFLCIHCKRSDESNTWISFGKIIITNGIATALDWRDVLFFRYCCSYDISAPFFINDASVADANINNDLSKLVKYNYYCYRCSRYYIEQCHIHNQDQCRCRACLACPKCSVSGHDYELHDHVGCECKTGFHMNKIKVYNHHFIDLEEARLNKKLKGKTIVLKPGALIILDNMRYGSLKIKEYLEDNIDNEIGDKVNKIQIEINIHQSRAGCQHNSSIREITQQFVHDGKGNFVPLTRYHALESSIDLTEDALKGLTYKELTARQMLLEQSKHALITRQVPIECYSGCHEEGYISLHKHLSDGGEYFTSPHNCSIYVSTRLCNSIHNLDNFWIDCHKGNNLTHKQEHGNCGILKKDPYYPISTSCINSSRLLKYYRKLSCMEQVIHKSLAELTQAESDYEDELNKLRLNERDYSKVGLFIAHLPEDLARLCSSYLDGEFKCSKCLQVYYGQNCFRCLNSADINIHPKDTTYWITQGVINIYCGSCISATNPIDKQVIRYLNFAACQLLTKDDNGYEYYCSKCKFQNHDHCDCKDGIRYDLNGLFINSNKAWFNGLLINNPNGVDEVYNPNNTNSYPIILPPGAKITIVKGKHHPIVDQIEYRNTNVDGQALGKCVNTQVKFFWIDY